MYTTVYGYTIKLSSEYCGAKAVFAVFRAFESSNAVKNATLTLHRKATPVAGDIPKSEFMIVKHINRFVYVNIKG